jgi:hypothetical protein
LSARGDLFVLAERHPALIRYRAAWKIRRTDHQRLELQASIADARAALSRTSHGQGAVRPGNLGAWMVLWLWDDVEREDEIEAQDDLRRFFFQPPGSA